MGIDLERQKQAKEYARLRHRLVAVEMILSALFLALALTTGFSARLRDVVWTLTTEPILAFVIYFCVAAMGWGILFAPLTLYSGFILPHRFDMSNQTFGEWLKDMFKGGMLSLVLGGIIIGVIYALMYFMPQWWWLIACAFILLFTIVLSNLAPILILPLFFKFIPLDDAELVERLTRLAKQANTRVNGIYTMVMSDRTNAANAAFMGLGNTKRIVLGDTLYENFTHDEIETILAHELAHQVHNDIVRGIVVQTFLALVGFFVADVALRAGVTYFGFHGITDLAAMPLLAIGLGAFGLITMPLGNWYSRTREIAADQYALETTRNPQAFISAFEKLANQNLAEIEPEPWVEWLLYDHPPIGKRLEMGHAFETPA